MESLYTKYRPQTFADVVGQVHVVTTLERAVMEGRTSHAYLFCGPRGTGKTTMARLLAKALMCEQGPGHLPDGSCEQCQMIAAGEHPDVYELDAASRTGVDNVRDEIISRVSFAPVRAPYKMYIIDEVHMLTTAAFNALLKTLEEPPAHVVFVLCTTDPQKIPETILSRVQRFDFHSIGNADIQARLAHICEREGFAYDPEALALVVRHARGGMRDAISELEQLSVSGGGAISVDVARDVLGEVSASMLERVSMGLANRDVPLLFAQVESLVEVGRDLLQFTNALAARLRDVYVVAAIGANSGTVQAPDEELPSLSREAQTFGSVDRVARALALLSDAATEMRVAPNQRLVLEVALTKIARPQTELTLEALADRVASLERQVAVLAAPAARQGAPAGEGSAATRAAQERRAGGERAASPAQPQPQSQAQSQAGSATGPSSQGAPQANDAAPHAGQAVAPAPQPQKPSQHTAHTAQNPAPHSPVQAPQQVAPASHPATSAPQPATSAQQPVAPAAYQGAPVQQSAAPASQQIGPMSQQSVMTPQPATSRTAAPASQGDASFVAPAVATSASQPAGPSPAADNASFATQQPRERQAPQDVAAITDPGELQRRWKQVVDGLLASRPQHGSLLMSSVIVADDGHELQVSLPKGSAFAFRMLERADVRANVDPAIAQAFGPRKVRFYEGGISAETAGARPAPAQGAARPTSQDASQSAPVPAHQAASAPAPQPQPGASSPQPVSAQPRPARQTSATAPQAASTPQSHATPNTAHAPATAQQPAQASSQQAAQVEAAAQQPDRAQAPALQPTASASYPAPWEPVDLGADVVPYDDFDAAPYEEDYVFGLVDEPMSTASMPAAMPVPAPRPVATPAPQPVPAPQQASAQAPVARPAAASQPAPAYQQSATPQTSASVGQSSAPVAAQPPAPSQPQRESVSVPASQENVVPAQVMAAQQTPAPVPAQQQESAPVPTQQQAPESSPAPQEPAPAPKPKAKRTRKASGIPADIVAMMAEIFGEGVTYTTEVPEDEDEAETEIDETAIDDATSENEFIDEPVDDADYEDEG